MLPGRPEVIAPVFTSHPAIRMLSFTGSPRIGKLLLGQAQYRRVIMELGAMTRSSSSPMPNRARGGIWLQPVPSPIRASAARR